MTVEFKQQTVPLVFGIRESDLAECIQQDMVPRGLYIPREYFRVPGGPRHADQPVKPCVLNLLLRNPAGHYKIPENKLVIGLCKRSKTDDSIISEAVPAGSAYTERALIAEELLEFLALIAMRGKIQLISAL